MDNKSEERLDLRCHRWYMEFCRLQHGASARRSPGYPEGLVKPWALETLVHGAIRYSLFEPFSRL